MHPHEWSHNLAARGLRVPAGPPAKRLRTDGTMAPLDHTMADRPGHLTKDGRRYANLSFRLADASTVRIPPRVEGGRLYISVGEPMYLAISPDDKGWAGPDLRSSSDPNYDTIFDWYEFTYAHGQIPFGGNTTQVDQFAIPLTARLRQASSGTDVSTGIRLARAEVMSRYEDRGKPSSPDVLQCSGALAEAGMTPQAGVLGAELCAAFNRGVGADPDDWYRPRAYYDARGRDNDYAGFFHAISVRDRAYAFAYDDVNDQSSVTILPNAQPPTSLEIGIGW